MKIFFACLFTFLVFQQPSTATKVNGDFDGILNLISYVLVNATEFNGNALEVGTNELKEFIDAAQNLGPQSEEFIQERIEVALAALNVVIDEIKAHASGEPLQLLECFEQLEPNLTSYGVSVLNTLLTCVSEPIIPFAQDILPLLQHLNESNEALKEIIPTIDDCKSEAIQISCLVNILSAIAGNYVNVTTRIQPDIEKLTPEWQALLDVAGPCARDELPDIVAGLVDYGNLLVQCYRPSGRTHLKKHYRVF